MNNIRFNDKNNNYVNLLIRFISFESLHKTIKDHPDISSNDNRLKAIENLITAIQDKNFTFNEKYKSNNVLYNSIKHLRIKPVDVTRTNQQQDSVKSQHTSTIKPKSEIKKGNTQLKRETLLKSYLEDINNFKLPVNLNDKPKGISNNYQLWDCLSLKQCSKTFPRDISKDTIRAFFKSQSLCTWNEENIKIC